MKGLDFGGNLTFEVLGKPEELTRADMHAQLIFQNGAHFCENIRKFILFFFESHLLFTFGIFSLKKTDPYQFVLLLFY